jgi:hypothetical protein
VERKIMAEVLYLVYTGVAQTYDRPNELEVGFYDPLNWIRIHYTL